MQIASDEIVITMTREELRDLDKALRSAQSYWERNCPTQDIEDGPDAEAMDGFNDLSMFRQRIVHKELAR